MNKVKYTYNFLKRSSQRNKNLGRVVKFLQPNKAEIKLITCNDTRWNSTLHMLKRYVELKKSIDIYIKNDSIIKPHTINYRSFPSTSALDSLPDTTSRL